MNTLFIMSIIAIIYNSQNDTNINVVHDDAYDFTLLVLTESQNGLKLGNPRNYSFLPYNEKIAPRNGPFHLYREDCQNSSICSQIWQIEANHLDCNLANHIDFSGQYILEFGTPSPPSTL
eukprot:416562_1